MNPNKDHSNFHTDQGKWERRDFEMDERIMDDEDDLDLSAEEAATPDHMERVHLDSELEAVVKELLHNSHRMDASDITVVVENSNVRLSGTVKTQKDRDYALGIVKLVHGVGDVKSDLIVKTHDGILPTDIGRD